jgi:histidine ammonia-lyase
MEEIELFTAAQALDFRAPLKPGNGVESAHQYIRKQIPHAQEDHFFKDEINIAVELLMDKDLITPLKLK